MTLADIARIARDIVELAAPVLVVAGATSLILFACLRLAGIAVERSLVLFPIAFAILGGITGAIAGSSAEPLVGGLVTGTLAIVTALLSYGMAVAGNNALRGAIPSIIILLLLNALAGLSVGQSWKRKWDVYANQMDRYRARRDGIWVPVTREYQMRIVQRCVSESADYTEALRRCRIEVLFPDDA